MLGSIRHFCMRFSAVGSLHAIPIPINNPEKSATVCACRWRNAPSIHLFLTLLLILFLAPKPSEAGNFEVFGPFNQVHAILYKGQIEVGDGSEFLRLTEDVERAIVFLESPGGLVSEGLTIASTIARRGYSTAVVADRLCASMCGIIWVSGRNRYLDPESQVGFHSIYVKYEDGSTDISSSGNAEIGAYLNTIGLPVDAIKFLTTAGPREMVFIDHADARTYGIDTVLFKDGSVSPPEERPTPESLALIFGAAGMYQMHCEFWVPHMPKSLAYSKDLVHSEAMTMVDQATFDHLIYGELDRLLYGVEQGDTVRLCLRAEDVLRDSGMETGIYGPGYDCSQANTASQHTLCRERSLWADDYMMNRIYLILRDAPKSSVRDKFFKGQRAWMTMRETCGGEVLCLSRQYENRFAELHELVKSAQ